ncbi:MAG TPA: GNAT family protein [Chloroflexia bacterium]|nr:GNAT family protein [Chloroflexia bacterium]
MELVFPELETERLLLKRLEDKHAPALLKIWSQEEVMRYTDTDPFTSLSEIQEEIMIMDGLFKAGHAIRWGIFEKSNQELVGSCGFHKYSQQNKLLEIGYELGQAYWGNGYMTEALRAVITYCFNVLGVNRIEALILKGNERSERVVKKLGFKFEGVLLEHSYYKGQFWDEESFALLRKDWK